MVKRKVPTSEPSGGCDDEEKEDEIKDIRYPPFRNPDYQHQTMIGGKKKTWRSLKQIVAHERSLPWPKDTPLYSTIGAPPSFLPPKKYSDTSGLESKYIDPQTKLFYSTSEEFTTVRSLPSDIISGYLALRGANNPIG